MPELPEVEAVRSQLEKYVLGHKIESVKINYPKIFEGDPGYIIGAKIIKVRRFAKVLILDLSNKKSLFIQIKMTGQLIYRGPNLERPRPLSKKVYGGVPGKHTHAILFLDRSAHLYYNDMRKFGRIKIVATEDVEKTGLVGKMGPEPFNGLTQKVFKELLGKSKKAIKILIMDQHKISGIGNIYANDALWLAGLSPMKPANELNTKVVIKLYKSILKVLEEGIKYGGASENAFVTPDGTDGNYQKHILVYGTAGQLCKKPKCRKLGAKIKRVAQGGRGTYYCTNCQTDKS